MTERAFGVDVAKYQGIIDYDTLVRGPIQPCFIGIRFGISWGYIDSLFPRNWAEAKRVKLSRFTYHVLYPLESTNRQFEHWKKGIGEDLPEAGWVIDAELTHGGTRRQITSAIRSMYDQVSGYTGDPSRVVLYTRTGWLNQYAYPRELVDIPLWLAQYMVVPPGKKFAPEYEADPTLPLGASSYLVHQTGDHTPALGFGIPEPPNGTIYLDYDRFNGTPEDFSAWVNREKPIKDDEKLDILWTDYLERKG